MREVQGFEAYGALALCYSDKCFRHVDRQYTKNEDYYRSVFASLDQDPFNLASRLPVRVYNRMKKALSIVVDCENHGTRSHVVKLLQKGYQSAYTYVNQGRTKIDVDLFLNWLSKSSVNFNFSSSTTYLVLALYYFAHIKDKSFYPSITDDDVTRVVTSSVELENLKDVIEVTNWRSSTDRKSILQSFGLVDAEPLSYNDVLSSIVVLEEKEVRSRYNHGNSESSKNKPTYGFDSDKLLASLSGLNKCPDTSPELLLSNRPSTSAALLFSTLATTLGFDETFLLDEYKVDSKTLSFLSDYIMLFRNQRIFSDKEVNLLFSGALVLYAVHQEYSDLRKAYFDLQSEYESVCRVQDTSQEVVSEDVFDELEKCKKEIELLNKEVATLKETNVQLSGTLDVYKEDLETANTSVRRLECSLSQSESKLRDLPALREFYYSAVMTENAKDTDPEPIEVFAVNELKKLKGVFVGGHLKQHIKLSKILPNFKFISTDEVSRDISIISGADVVFYYSWYSNHNMFERVVSQIDANNVPLVYVPRATNMNRILTEMYNKYKEVEETSIVVQ